MNDNLKISKSSFYPLSELSNKQNYKRYYIINRDGTIFEKVFLDIPIPSLREKIICYHYLSRRVKFFETNAVGMNIISRDNPWDFEIELSTGENFNVEITSIAEDSKTFEMLKREERLKLNRNKPQIQIHELEKLNYFFPDNSISKLIDSYKKENISKQTFVENSFAKDIATIGSINEFYPSLDELIERIIDKKENKKHKNKDRTVLLIDNRTFRFEISHLRKVMDKLEKYFEDTSFMEIWFYTGYYSSLDGNDAEYNLAPLKITKEQEIKLEKFAIDNPANDLGIIYD